MSELRYFRSKSRDTTGRGGDTEYYLSLQVLWEATTTKTGTTHRKTRESFSQNFFGSERSLRGADVVSLWVGQSPLCSTALLKGPKSS